MLTEISDLHALFGDDMHPSADSTNPPTHDVYALWDRLAEFSAGDGDAALIHLLTTLCAMVAAQNALWSVVVRLPSPTPKDALFGWRPRLVRLLHPVPAVAASVQEQFDTLWSSDVDLSQILQGTSRSAPACSSRHCRPNGSKVSTIGAITSKSATPTACRCVARSTMTCGFTCSCSRCIGA